MGRKGRPRNYKLELEEAYQYEVACLIAQSVKDGKVFSISDAAAEMTKRTGEEFDAYRIRTYWQKASESKMLVATARPPVNHELAQQVVDCFGLRHAIFVPALQGIPERRISIGTAAAHYFESLVDEHRAANTELKLGISGGYFLNEMVFQLERRPRPIDIFPTALIGRGPDVEHVDPQTVLTMLWAKCGAVAGKAHYATILPQRRDTSLVNPHEQAQRLCALNERVIAENPETVGAVLEGMKGVDVAFVSFGPTDPALAAGDAQLSTLHLLETLGLKEWICSEGIVGDVSYSFFGEDGSTKDSWKVFITLGIKHFKNMVAARKPVVLLAGQRKAKILFPLLEEGIINVLIADTGTARELLDLRSSRRQSRGE